MNKEKDKKEVAIIMSKLTPDFLVSKEESNALIKSLDLQNSAEITEDEYIKHFGVQSLKTLLFLAMEESNHFDMGKRKIKTNTDIKQIVGSVMENFIVGIMGIDWTIKNKVFQWCTGITPLTFKENMYGYDSYISLLFAVKVLGRNAKTTKIYVPSEHSSSATHDIEFYVKDLLRIDTMTQLGGLQIKALQGNEKDQIVIPVLNKKYHKVLTLLKSETGKHSYDRCLNALNKLLEKGEINTAGYLRAKNEIKKPNDVGIPQKLINSIYDILLKMKSEGIKLLDKDGNIISGREPIVSGLITAIYTLDQGESLTILEGKVNLNESVDN